MTVSEGRSVSFTQLRTRRLDARIEPMISGVPHTTVHELACVMQFTQMEDVMRIDARVE